MFKLLEDGSNWPIYERRALAQLRALGLSRHLRGSIPKPVEIVYHERTGEWYLPTDTSFRSPLSPEEINAYEDKLREYLMKEEKGTIVLADSLPQLVYSRIMRLPTLKEKWNTLCGMFTIDKYRSSVRVRTQLESAKYQGDPILLHLWMMEELRDQFADFGRKMSNVDFVTLLARSLDIDPIMQRGVSDMVIDEDRGKCPLDMDRVRYYMANRPRHGA
ncbi:hypothetical protein BJ165DRAFT_1419299 [Panaeolus papilionaceus]|nr:hypothetical protein BJ165DRAFT_1419299 [Panaeolus papilionaceus]